MAGGRFGDLASALYPAIVVCDCCCCLLLDSSSCAALWSGGSGWSGANCDDADAPEVSKLDDDADDLLLL